MGDPRKQKKKYKMPVTPWNKERIEEEKELTKNYGIKNKKELLRINSKLSNYKEQAKHLTKTKTKQAQKEEKQLITHLSKYGLIKTNKLEEVFGLELRQLLDRRLQSIVFSKGLAKTMKQSRQFIIHQHIQVNNKKITSPNYLVSIEEEPSINFAEKSSLASELHPERNNGTVKEISKKTEEKKEKTTEKAKNPATKKEENKK